MVSRRKILSRSRDDLNLDQTFSPQEEEEDVWYQKEKLYKEHIQEVLDKWTQIDDEIWAKVIVFERNRRVAKAYARAPVLTINGSDDGFDGMRIGLCGFDNPMRDQKTEELKKHIGQGVKIKMDDAGNILIRRYAKSNVYIKSTASNQNEETSIGGDILKLPNQALESEKIVKLFDMKKFQSNVNRELRRAYPDRRRLETQCLSAVAFVKSESDILECPIWVLIVNVVAMDMLKSKLPPVQRPIVDIKNRPRIPIPDEDPYSVAGNGSGGSSGSSGFGSSAMSSMMSLQQQQQLLQQQSQSMTGNNNGNSNIGSNIGITANGNGNNNVLQHLNNGMVAGINGSGHVAATREQLIMQSQQLAHKRSEKPPKLPPRDNVYGHDIPKPDYDDIEVDTRIKLSRGKSDKGKDNKKYDDPYYCGLRARVPNFVKSSSKSTKEQAALLNGTATQQQQQQHMNTLTNQKKNSIMMPMHPAIHAPAPPHMHPQHLQQQQMMAAVAAHAVAQQQQQQHPIHHHHVQHAAAAAAAQQMWQTRSSYESGIGIYNHNTTLPTGATTATATNFHNNTDLQQQQQQHQHSQASTAYYPSTNASSSLYNYLAPNYQEHLQSQQMLVQQQQQQQHHHIINSTSSTTATALTSPLSNSGNLLPAATQSIPAIANGLAPSTSIQLSTNLTFNTNPNIETQQKPKNENIYGQTRNLNLKHSTPITNNHHHTSALHNHGHTTKNGHQHHHHSHYNHHHHHHRRHHHGSYGCLMQTPHTTTTRHNAGECRYKTKTHEIDDFDDFNHRSHNKHLRASRRSSSATTQPDNNCNCMSCYTLAPLFGVPTPKRPPRSLSQQQLRQHQRLSGAKTGYSNVLKRGVVKWCSDSDVSLLGREEWEQTEPSDDYNHYANHKTDEYYDAAYDQNDFNFDQDFDIENFTLTQMDYKKQLQKPKATANFNAFAVRHKYSAKETQQSLTDDYVDKARLRQIRSPTPKQKESLVRDSYTRQPLNLTLINDDKTNLLTMRTKSQSTESFFEQPHEEGPIYLYGGRKRIPKAPSTTNIYDRVKNHNNNEFYLYRKENLTGEQRKNLSKISERSDHDTIRPLVPPPLWRGAKRMNLKVLTKPKLNNQQQQQQQQLLDQNNNPLNISSSRQNTKINNNNNNNNNNLYKTEEAGKMTSTMTATALATSTNNKTSTHNNTSSNHHYKTQLITQNDNDNNTVQQQQKEMEKHHQQQQITQRIGRSSSRNHDFSDMESIYGYLKPRKPRSLSMKKIHILDY